MCHLAAACSPECGSWWMAACSCRLPSLTTLAATRVCPAMASRARPRPLPTSLCSVSLTPAPSPGCLPPLCQAKLLPHNLPLPPPPPDPAQVTSMPPETPLPVGMRGVIRCPVRANPPLLFVSWTKDGQALQLDKVQAAGQRGLSLVWYIPVRPARVVCDQFNSIQWRAEGHPCLEAAGQPHRHPAGREGASVFFLGLVETNQQQLLRLVVGLEGRGDFPC